MLFSEIYGSYFQVVAAVLAEAAEGGLTDSRLTELVREKAFAESVLSIPAALRSGEWPLLAEDLSPILRHSPTMPLTELQKRWLKSLLLDRRIKLFAPDTTGLEDVEPLYRPDTFVWFDQYADGDPYEDRRYIECFRTILQSLRERRRLRLRFHGRTSVRHSAVCVPYRLEYSAKDDKFRLLTAGDRAIDTVNVARIHTCELLEAYGPEAVRRPQKCLRELVLLLHEERNALERVLLHFSHFEKETRKLDEGLYRIDLRYDQNDETELLIRVLSFGPMLEVTAPEEFIALVNRRLEQQFYFSAAQGAGGYGKCT